MTPTEAARAFADALKAKVPTLATQVDALLADPGAVEELGRGVLMRQDHSRLMNEAATVKANADTLFTQLKAAETKQNAWWTQAQADVELGRQAREAAWTPGTPDPNNPNPNPSTRTAAGLTPEDVDKRLNDREVGQALFVTTLGDLSFKHFQRFGQVLDTNTLVREVMSDPAAKDRGLIKHYEHKFSAEIAAADKKAADAAFDKAYQERRAQEMRDSASRPPYPTGSPNAAGSPLDALEPVKPATTAAGQSVDDAVAAYNELVAAGGGR